MTRTGHGSWYLTVELPPGPSGARRRLRRGGYRTRAEAHRALTGLRPPDPADPHRALLTTGQWLQHWVATRLRPRPATLRSYHQHIQQHLIPHLGGIVLRELCLDDVQTTFAILARTPTRYGRARAASTLHRIRATLRVALNAAMRRGLIGANPARYLELPPASRPRAVVWTPARVAHWRATGEHPTVAVWTAHQTAQFLHHIRQHRLYPLFRLITLVGLRRGEACALRWCDLDLQHRALLVSRQLQHHGGELALCETKTTGSVRAIALDRLTVTVLRRHHTSTALEGHRGGFVFTNLRGDPIKPDRLGELFHRLVREADLPPIRLHDLRHGAASLSLAAGNDLKTVQTMLGHSSIVLTADTYTSVLPDLAHHAAEATARPVLTSATTTSRALRNGHHTSHQRPAKRSPRVTIPPQRSTPPSYR
ncbi:MAG: tyrosine-type recombinase/integrase [Pseudonocardiaceae bacterium]